MTEARWYAARTKPRQDQVAVENLARQNFQIYSPRVTIERIRRGRITTGLEQFFPGYLLIHFALSDASWRAINSTRGVSRLISFSENGIPTAFPVGEIERLQVREKRGELFHTDISRVRRGDCVRLKVGPAADKIGRVLWTRGERIEFLLSLLGRETKVKAPLHLVEVVSQRHER